MSPTLYFLRSSEQNIVTQMLHFSSRLDEIGKTIHDVKELDIYHKQYGLNSKDLGLYALVKNEIAGAVWLRLLKQNDNSNAYIDDNTPVLHIGVKPKFRGEGIGSAMLEQLFLEAGTLYKQVSISVLNNETSIKYFEKFGFTKIENSVKKSPVDSAEVLTMIKQISNQAVQRPNDGYNPQKWMD